MIPDEVLKVADEVLFSHTGKHLTDIQRMILQKSWDDKGYEDMLDEGWALPTGTVYYSLGDYGQAIECYRQHLIYLLL